MTTIAMTASPGQRFIGLPSGAKYTADNTGSIAAVQQQDVLAMLNAGASFVTSGGGGGTTSPVRQTVTASTTIAKATTDIEINQTASSTYTLAGGWTADGFELKFKDVGGNLSATNVATITPPAGFTIDGQASFTLTAATEGVKLKVNLNTSNLDVFG